MLNAAIVAIALVLTFYIPGVAEPVRHSFLLLISISSGVSSLAENQC